MEHEKEPSSLSQKPSLLRGLLGTLIAVSSIAFYFWSKSGTPDRHDSSNTAHPQDTTTNPSEDRPPVAPLRVIVERIKEPLPPSPEVEARENRKEGREQLNLDTQRVIAFFAFAYATVAIFQWCALLNSNKINREALTSVQRAFVTFSQISLDTYPHSAPNTGDDQWVFTAFVENGGTTPAINKIAYFTGDSSLQDEPSEQQFIGSDQDRPIGEIGPKAQKGIGPIFKTDEFVLGKYPLSGINTKEFNDFFLNKRIFLWGWVAYRDVFSDTRPHVTEFCEEVNGVFGVMVPIPNSSSAKRTDSTKLQPKLHFKECKSHNCTDEHCADYQTIASLVHQ